MDLNELLKNVDTEEIIGDLEQEIKDICSDSRSITPNSLFVSIKGFKVDGNKFIEDAIKCGAICIVSEDFINTPNGISFVKVTNSRKALSKIASNFYDHPSKKFNLIGITGTKGKTTTTYMIKSVLETANQKVGLIGTLGTKIGNESIHSDRTTPDSLELQKLFKKMVVEDVQSVVMEVSSQGLKLDRVSGCDYDIGVFTNLSQDHISPNEHSSMEDYFESKLKLFKMCKIGFVNIDNKYGEKVVENSTCNIYTYAIDKHADIMAVDIIAHQDSVEFTVQTPWGNGRIKVNIPGKFTIYNALAAIGVCCQMGVSIQDVINGLSNISVPGRAEVIYRGNDFTVITDYAHTPDSLENILTTFKAYVKGRLVCVFGCGGDRDKTKRPIMGEIAGKISDFCIVTSDNPRSEEPSQIIREIEEGVKTTSCEYTIIENRYEAIEFAIKNAKKGDIIILAGKGDETYQILKNETIHFDEREVVKEIMQNIK